MASSEGREDNCAGISVDATGSGGGQNGTELWYSSSDQALDSSSPSTSPSYWDSDDDDPGPRPSDLYGKFTWKIEKFSEISNRELRSNVFEVGGYKWYILVYPQGCDVCNHLSLFLCVSDYDKLLPGWSHFAQFTIAVVNKDPKKSKYSDTLHRFCKKEHDWGWKKFMELSKVLDGFIVADILVIKAQVQVIRENPNRPFRCLDSQYRRELVRVYLTNVEGICRRFVEEKREKLGTFIEDVSKWSSFCAFWLAIDESVRHHLSREKTDVILKAIVKQFFNEKEVTSTVVMDALYSGYKTLNDQNKSKKEKADGSKGDNNFPVVSVENDYFVLVDDVLSLLEKAAAEPLPPFKEDKGPQNRTKDCSGDDFAKDSVERDERRLTDLGKRTIEIYVLSHLFSNRVEVAYREAIALKRQEELIREEEAAGQAEMEFRAKHQPAEKEKKSKKKQAKQRRNHRKDKKRMREEKPSLVQGKDLRLSVQKQNPERCSDESATPNFVSSTMGDEDADLSGIDMLDNVVGTLGPAIENGDAYRVDWDRDGSEPHQSMEASFSGDASSQAAKSDHTGRRHQSTLDDSSSTCSTDSLASAAVNGSCKEKMSVPYQNQSNRRKLKSSCEEAKKVTLSKTQNFSRVGTDSNPTQDGSSSTTDLCSKTVILSLKEHIHWLEQRLAEKEEEVLMLQEKLSLQTHQAHDFLSKNQHSDSTADGAAKNGSDPPSLIQSDEYKQASSCAPADTLSVNSNKPSCHSESPATSIAAENGSNQRNGLYNSNTRRNKMPGLFASGKHDDLKSPTHHMDRMQPSIFSQKRTAASGDSPSFDSGNSSAPMPSESNEAPVASVLSRPSSAPLIPAVIRPTTVSLTVPNAPALSRSASASGRLGAVELTAANLSLPQSTSMTPSYKMAAVGKLRNSYTNQVSLTVAGVNTNSAEDTSQGPNVTHSTMILKNPLSAPTSAASNIPVSPIKNYRVAVNSEYSKGQRKGGSFSSSNSASPCLSAASVSSQSMTKVDHTTFRSPKHVERAVGFTFGSVTPEMLKHQRSNTCIPGLEEDAIKVDQNKQESVFAQHIQQQGQGSQNLKFYQPQDQGSSDLRMHQTLNDLSIDGTPSHVYYPLTDARQGGSLSSDEFPHIDIINDLLDDEHYRGRKMPYHSTAQNSNRDIAFPSFERLNSDDLPPDLNIINGDIGWSRLQEEGLFQLRAFSDPSSVALGDNSHRVSPYTHSPYAQPRSQLGNVFDGVPCHWPVNNADFSAGGINGNAYDNADGHISYHLHANAMSLSDSSSFSSGQTEYTMPSPRKDM